MDLFAITCTTCKSRLKVRDQAAVGQILACPKCGGMVMVKPPPAWNELSDQKSDLPTATEMESPPPQFNQTLHSSAFDVLEDLLSDAPPMVQPPASKPPSATPQPANATPSPSASPKPRFIGGPPVHRSSTPPIHRSATPPPLPAGTTGTPPPTPLSPPALKINAPQSADAAKPNSVPPVVRTSKPQASPAPAHEHSDQPVAPQPSISGTSRNHWLLMSASIAVGSLLAFAAVSFAIHLLRPASVAKAIPKRPAAKTNASDPSPEPYPKSSISVSPGDPEPATNSKVDDTPPDRPQSSEPTRTQVVDVPESRPLDLVKTPSAITPPLVATKGPLDQFGPLLQPNTEDPLATTPAPAAPETPPVSNSAPTPAKSLAPRPPPREVDVVRRLADTLTAIETSGTPLTDFVQVLSDLSTIPITLEVPFYPATPQLPITLNLTNTNVGKALAEGLRPLRLEYEVADDHLIVRRVEPAVPTPFSVTVQDLAGNEEQPLTELADLLKTVVEPSAWSQEGGGSIAVDAAKGALVITHRRAVQFQIRVAIEKLRSARSSKPPSADKLELYNVETRSSLANANLQKSISLNYLQPTRLTTILDRLGAAAGVRIVVDWRDIASAGWNPAGEATLVAANQPLADALDALLDPLDLTWRVIDSQTLQVVTPARLNELAELEVYKIDSQLAAGANPEALVAQIRSSVGESLFIAGGGSGEIQFEPGSKCLLVWLSQPKHREVELLLTKPRAETKHGNTQ